MNEIPTVSGADQLTYLYLNGYVKADFPSKGLRKEFERCLLSLDEKGNKQQFLPVTSAQAPETSNDHIEKQLYELVSKPSYRYIARQMTWKFTNRYGHEIYCLTPTESQLSALILAIKPRKNKLSRPMVLVGYSQASLASRLPNVDVKRLTKVSPCSIIKSIKGTMPNIDVDKLKLIVSEILSLSTNRGDNDQDRALNYILYQNLAIYSRTYGILYDEEGGCQSAPNARLANIQVLPMMSGDRHVVKVVFEYQNTHGGGSQSWYSAVDVTDEYPFLLGSFERFLPRY
ncbi:cyanobactin maturation protease PatG family protein [Shewanella surugensis]|uniref:PatG domain-containing protein n=1 Tax=Shewanella surugensis TaxID=212020 RepID=A0ABT0LB88_9GAMM|nr:hypothetical protein [Shewanella surugensis]MCL1124966.1 hypothetical protein [Shewanella surugensis]